MTFAEQLLDAVGDVGMDLVDMSEKIRFPKSFLRRTLPVAACMALLLGAGLYFRTWFTAEPAAAEQEHMPSVAEAPELEVDQHIRVKQSDTEQSCYLLRLPGQTRRVAAVDRDGTVLAEAEDLSFITDAGTGDYLGILATTVYGTDSEWNSAERIIYDMQGKELGTIEAKEILCVGDLVAVNYHYGEVTLYLRDGTEVAGGFAWAIAYADCMAVGDPKTDTVIYYDPSGAEVMVDTAYDNLIKLETYDEQTPTWFRKTENGLAGLVNLYGNWVVEPRFAEFGVPENGYIPCTDIPGDHFLVDLETGKIVCKAQNGAMVKMGYGDVVMLYSDGYCWLENFYGTVIVPLAARIQIADDDRDGTPELFVATKQNGDVVYYEPDGTERLRICGAGAVETISSDYAVYTRTVQDENTGEWAVDFALIDLQTGQGNREFEKPYTRASRLDGETVLTDLFYAWYEDSAGNSRVDLLDASGTVLLEDLQVLPGTEDQYANGDVFLTAEGYCYADGIWLYRFD